MALIPRPITLEDKLSAGISAFMGAIFIGIGFWVGQLSADERANWIETQGVVIDNVSRRLRTDEQTMYAPVIEFKANGRSTQLIGSYTTYRLSAGKEW